MEKILYMNWMKKCDLHKPYSKLEWPNLRKWVANKTSYDSKSDIFYFFRKYGGRMGQLFWFTSECREIGLKKWINIDISIPPQKVSFFVTT